MCNNVSIRVWKFFLSLCLIVVVPAFAHDPSNLQVSLDSDAVTFATCGAAAKDVKATVSFDHTPETLTNCATCARDPRDLKQEEGERSVAVRDHSCVGGGVLSVALASYKCQDTVGYSQATTLKVTCEKVTENKKERCRPHVNGTKVASAQTVTLKIFGVAGTCSPAKCRKQGQRVDTACYPPNTGCKHSKFAQLKISCPAQP